MSLFGKREEKAAPTATSVQPEASQPVAPAPRQQRSPAAMNPQQLGRTLEARRLAETKLANTEESLERLRQQQEWLRRYSEVQLSLDQEKVRLSALTKQVSSLSADESALRRFETFEAVQPTFLRMRLLERAAAQNRQQRLALEQTTKEQQAAWGVQQKIQQQAADCRQQAETAYSQTIERVFQGLELRAANDTFEREIAYLREQLRLIDGQRDSLEGSMREHTADVERTNRRIEALRTERQSIEMHERMLKHGEAILLLLDRLQQIELIQADLRARMDEATRRQDEENELLQRVFSQYREVSDEIESCSEETKRQRIAIQGQTAVKLLERAMSLKNRLQMLLSAQSLWNKISIGYTLIEEHTQSLNAQRLLIEHTEANVAALETETARLARLCHEKEYTYMLSKSQDVIRLRSDLHEGVSCSVCGATHHPYHCDSMLEQSKLIGEFKSDFEHLAVEVKNKQSALSDLKIELAECRGRHQLEERLLSTLRKRQADDVREWHVFSSLDHSFLDCSPTTNLEARQAMLRQLIENTTRDADNAQKDLERFNFHRDAINELTEKLQGLERRKSELVTRLNEVNTGCQVMASQVERLQQMLDGEGHHYSQTYSELDKLITIPEWLHAWKESREGLKGRVQQLLARWDELERRIDEEQTQLADLESTLQGESGLHRQVKDALEALNSRIEDCQSSIDENSNAYKHLLGQVEARALFAQAKNQKSEAYQAEQAEQKTTQRMQGEIEYIRGREENYAQVDEQLSADLAMERSKLDHWIHNFNMHNPPVQYAELEDVFSEGKDWNALREQLKQVRLDHALSQARVDMLNSRLIALQAEGGRTHVDEDEMQASIIAQRETLEARRDEIMLQIARLTIALEEHEKATTPPPEGLA
ncbi:MAG: hypothetical protein K5945_08030 [Bacteroidaceae bacterium]|nr:hypothetical protein [Bacteroidaceae bacterium]